MPKTYSKELTKTEAWQAYELGVDYKERINLYSSVDRNERFWAGDHWAFLKDNDVPKPVLNFIKYGGSWKIAAVSDRKTALKISAENNQDPDINTYANQLSGYIDILRERMKMDYHLKLGLKDAFVSGDMITYFYWDESIETGQALKGDINKQSVDNVNYYPGNPNEPNPQKQPYIILVFRQHVKFVKEEAERNRKAKKNSLTKDEIEYTIIGDSDTEYTSGDRGKIELDDDSKINVLLKLYKKDGKIYSQKCTKYAVIQEEKDTKLTRYPIAMMNWETRKNSAHGEGEVTYLIPNQVYVNKELSFAQLFTMQMSFPKVIYDKNRIKRYSNKVAASIPVNGDVQGAAMYLNPPSMAFDVTRIIDATIEKSMQMMGATDITLGSIANPDNTSAFIANYEAAKVPLENVQDRVYDYLEQEAAIQMDFIQNFYTNGRKIPVMLNGQVEYVEIDQKKLKEATLRMTIDVGESTMWSEVKTSQTLDKLLDRQMINQKQYLERQPEGEIPERDKLLQELEEQIRQEKAMIAKQQAQQIALQQAQTAQTESQIQPIQQQI